MKDSKAQDGKTELKEFTGSVNVAAKPHPLRDEVLHAKARAGQTLYEVLGDINPQAVVFHNGEPVDHANLEDVVLAENDVVNVAVEAHGGGDNGNKALRTVLQIAITAATLAVDVIFPGAGRLLQAGIAAVIAVGGNLLVNALVPPSQIGMEQGNSESFENIGGLTGSRNRLVPYGPVPRVYGRHKMFPPMAAKPYTEIQSNTQYLHMLLCVGYGPVKLHNPKIGDTSIGSFDANNEFTPNGNFESILMDVGESPIYYVNDVDENAVSVNMDDGAPATTRTTAANAEAAGVDFLFPQGLFAVDEKGDTQTARCEFLIEYRENGSGDPWTNALESTNGGFLSNNPEWEINLGFGNRLDGDGGYGGTGTATDPVFAVSGDERETLRNGLTIYFPYKATWDVRVTRQYSSSAPSNGAVFHDATWTVLRSITYEQPVDLPGCVFIGLRIKATDQLTGVLERFNVEVESRLATYSGGTWDVPTFDPATGEGTGGALTSNPAWAFADVLAGDANARSVDRSKLDGAAIETWANYCDAEGFEYNSPGDNKNNVFELSKAIAAAGRASFGVQDGLFTAIIDKAQATPVQMFTPRNSWNFSATRSFPKVPHAIKVRFIDPNNNWQENERIVYDDGYDASTATRFEVLELPGVTDSNQAWKMGRYYLAQIRLRPETYTFEADVEHIVCFRGDMVRVQHDVPLWGISSGRIKSVTTDVNGDVTEIKVDEICTMEAGKNYAVTIRTDQDFSVNANVVTNAGEHTTLTLTSPIDSAQNVSKGDLVAFGEQGTQTVDLKVLAIEPRQDLVARITAVDAAPEIDDAGILPKDVSAGNVNVSTDSFNPNDNENPFYNGDVLRVATTGDLPAPLLPGTDYYVVARTDTTFKLSDTQGGSVIDITSQGNGVHTFTRQIPDYDSQITEPVTIRDIIPPAPRIENIRSDEYTSSRDNDGSYSLRVVLSFTIESGFPTARVEGRYRKAGVKDGWVGYKTVNAGNGVISFDGLEVGVDYIIQIRTVNFNQESEWVEATTHNVDGKKFPPLNATNFLAVIDKLNVRLSWDASESPDVKEYEIREGDSWASSTLVGRTDSTVLADKINNSGLRQYFIKAIDTSGNYSSSELSATIEIPDDFDSIGDGYSYFTKTRNMIELGVRGFEELESSNGEDFVDSDGEQYVLTEGDVEATVRILKGQIVLGTRDDGKIAAFQMDSTPEDGSLIDISADQVKINNIVFDEEAGTIASDNFSAGSSGWQIKGTGDAEFNNITVRGTVEDLTISGKLSNQDDDYKLTDVGITLKAGDNNGIGNYNRGGTLLWEDKDGNTQSSIYKVGVRTKLATKDEFWVYVNGIDVDGRNSSGATAFWFYKDWLEIQGVPIIFATLSDTQRDSLNAVKEGAVIYNTDAGNLQFYNGTSWNSV